MKRKVLTMSIVMMLGSTLWAAQPNESVLFDEAEVQSFEQAKFAITAGSVGVNAIGKYADGDYALQETSIKQLETKNTYIATLKFGIKKGMFSYSHIETLGVLYDGDKLWIKYIGKIYKYTVPSQTKTIDKQNTQVTYKVQRPFLDVQIEKMKLRFEF